ncbi:MAG TPA: hypothetical protein VJ302_26880 [Blastocatellia bacterium]|nr:hypothetical protein [Blastocatellia bacterium]
MSVLTSKQIRRRVAETERKIFAPKRRIRRPATAPSQEQIDHVITVHVRDMNAAIDRGDAYWAAEHARRAVNYLRVARGLAISRDYKRAFWKACDCARHELYNCEV